MKKIKTLSFAFLVIFSGCSITTNTKDTNLYQIGIETYSDPVPYIYVSNFENTSSTDEEDGSIEITLNLNISSANDPNVIFTTDNAANSFIWISYIDSESIVQTNNVYVSDMLLVSGETYKYTFYDLESDVDYTFGGTIYYTTLGVESSIDLTNINFTLGVVPTNTVVGNSWIAVILLGITSGILLFTTALFWFKQKENKRYYENSQEHAANKMKEIEQLKREYESSETLRSK